MWHRMKAQQGIIQQINLGVGLPRRVRRRPFFFNTLCGGPLDWLKQHLPHFIIENTMYQKH